MAELGSPEASASRTYLQAKQGCGISATARSAVGAGNRHTLAAFVDRVQCSKAEVDAQGRAEKHDLAMFKHRQRSVDRAAGDPEDAQGRADKIFGQRQRSLDRAMGEPEPEAASNHTQAKELLQTLCREMWTEYCAQSRILQDLATEVRQELQNFKDTIAAEVSLRAEMEARVAFEESQRLEVNAKVAKQAAQLREMSAHVREEIQQMELRLTQQLKSALGEEAIARKAVDQHLEEQMGRLRRLQQVEIGACHPPDDLRQIDSSAKQCEELWYSQLDRLEIQRSACSESPGDSPRQSPRGHAGVELGSVVLNHSTAKDTAHQRMRACVS